MSAAVLATVCPGSGVVDRTAAVAAAAAADDDDLTALVAVAPLSEKDGEVFSLDFNAHKHYYCRRPFIRLAPPTPAAHGDGCGDPAAAPTAVVQRVPGFRMDGTYAMLNVLGVAECAQIIALTERIGYQPTCIAGIAAQAATLRGPDKVVWCADQHLVDAVFERCRALLPQSVQVAGKELPLCGLSPRFRCLRYKVGQHQLGPHRDRGLYPMSQVDEDGELRYDVGQNGARSYMSFLIYLNEDFEGGETFFYAEDRDDAKEAAAAAEGCDAAVTAAAHPGGFVAGNTVEAVWSGDDDWYEATVTAVHLDADGDVSYDVRFDDDDQEEQGLPPRALRVVGSDGADEIVTASGGQRKTTLDAAEVATMRRCAFKPRTGACVVFYSAEEGLFDRSPIHEGGVVTGGNTRYVIRTDVIFGGETPVP